MPAPDDIPDALPFIRLNANKTARWKAAPQFGLDRMAIREEARRMLVQRYPEAMWVDFLGNDYEWLALVNVRASTLAHQEVASCR